MVAKTGMACIQSTYAPPSRQDSSRCRQGDSLLHGGVSVLPSSRRLHRSKEIHLVGCSGLQRCNLGVTAVIQQLRSQSQGKLGRGAHHHSSHIDSPVLGLWQTLLWVLARAQSLPKGLGVHWQA